MHRRSLFRHPKNTTDDEEVWINAEIYGRNYARKRISAERHSVNKKFGRRKRKPLSTNLLPRMLFYSVTMGTLSFISWLIITNRGNTYSNERVARHMGLYERVYEEKENEYADIIRPPGTLASVYGSTISSCPVTVLFMDPRLGDPSYGPGSPGWFALESVAAFAPDSCVLLLTSSCAMLEYLRQAQESQDEALLEYQAELGVKDAVYAKSLPLFRTMIEQKRVRLVFLDHTKYLLKACFDYGNPTSALINVNFWKDEFVESDSDLVLMVQDDAVLCQPVSSVLSQYYQDYAYVGAVWPRKATEMFPEPIEGMCRGMPNRWKTYLLPQTKWERQQIPGRISKGRQVIKPKQFLNTNFPNVCENGAAPIGNGGFSLRSRKWLIKAIQTCPHVKHSGIKTESMPLACKVVEDVNEDFYFSVVLQGLGAPMPPAIDASLFSVESQFPEDALQLYGLPAGFDGNELLQRRTSQGTISFAGRTVTIPLGFHKPFWYQPNELLRSNEISQACPYLRFIFEPKMSRYKEPTTQPPWKGIGT